MEDKQTKSDPQTEFQNEKSNNEQWCFSYYAGNELADSNQRAVLLKNTQWNAGDKITISFMDGDPAIQKKVKDVAMEWIETGMANLTFEFSTNTKDTDIRISFQFSGSWSVLGTTCKKIPKDKPTMNLGWLKSNTPPDELRRVVLHEFGHAIGLIHEHMNPAEGGIKWNKPQVEKDLSGPPNNWSPDVIFNNMFKTFADSELKLTAVDSKSIMMYPIPAKWTLDGFNVVLNTDLSDTDKKFVREIYPGND